MANSALVYNIERTEGGVALTIKPGMETNYSNIDLKFYGYGTPMWGFGVDSNAYRLLENFACPSKAALSPAGSAIIPQDEDDLGRDGLGINNPVRGQIWYNTTSDLFYYYDGSIWKQLGGLEITDPYPPSNPQDGQIVFNPTFHSASPNNGQIMVYIDGEWVSIAGEYVPIAGTDAITSDSPPREMEGNIRMGMNKITNLANPVDPQDAMTLSYAESIYLNAAGDTITGDMTVASSKRIVFFDTNDGYDYISISSNGTTANTLLAIRGSNSTNPATDVTLMEFLYNGGRYDMRVSIGDVELPGATVSSSNDAATKWYVDQEAGSVAFPSGTKLLFGSFPIPTGWTLDESAHDSVPIIVGYDPSSSPQDVYDLREGVVPTAEPTEAGQSDLPMNGSWTISGTYVSNADTSHYHTISWTENTSSFPEYNENASALEYRNWGHTLQEMPGNAHSGYASGIGTTDAERNDIAAAYVTSGYLDFTGSVVYKNEKIWVAGMDHKHTVTVSENTGSDSHDHTITGWRPKYRKVVMARKD